MKRLWFLVMSDLHVGDAFAPFPQNFMGSCGSIVNLNDGQLYLARMLEGARQEVMEITGGHLDALGIVGDAVHGKNRKQEGEYVIEPDMGFQARAALEVIKPFSSIAEVKLVCRGTGYHVGVNADTEEWIGYELGSVKDAFGHHCIDWAPAFSLAGVVFDIAHHQSIVMINRAMPLERERRFASEIVDLKGYPHLIIRAHGHIGRYVEIDGEASLGLPAMQLNNLYCRTGKTPNRMVSRYLGFVLIEVLPDLLGTTHNPFVIHWLRFRHPKLGKLEFFKEGEDPCETTNQELPCPTSSPKSEGRSAHRRKRK